MTWLHGLQSSFSSEKSQWTGISWVQSFMNLDIAAPFIFSWRDKSFHLGTGEMLLSKRKVREEIVLNSEQGSLSETLSLLLEEAAMGALPAGWQEHLCTHMHLMLRDNGVKCKSAHAQHTPLTEMCTSHRDTTYSDTHSHISTKASFTYRHTSG